MLKHIALLLAVLVTGCTLFSTNEPAPVVSLTDYKEITNGYHIVSPGETLYAIAWKYGRDYRDLAAVNHLNSAYTIYPNQKLNLRKPSQSELKQKPRTAVKSQQNTVLLPGNETWKWPLRGTILKGFNQQGGFKGIDINGTLASPVRAAKSGKVVYSGHGLRGYGNLLIIKHDDTYLSAYGHNQQLLVKEGDFVKQGQLIALMGKTGTSSVRLHFEIRKNGKPVNPALLLPK